jgi:hypothetical protein
VVQQSARLLLRDALRHPAVVVGRTAAACVHPVAAWRVLPASWRILALTVYAMTSYLMVLCALIALKP